MRINGITGLPAKSTSDNSVKSSSAKITDGLNLSAEATEISSTYLASIRKAQAAEEVNAQAIDEARQMLADGTLDTPENIDLAAETLVLLGV